MDNKIKREEFHQKFRKGIESKLPEEPTIAVWHLGDGTSETSSWAYELVQERAISNKSK